MDVLNAHEAYAYVDGLTDDRERSATLAVHLAYMDHCSSRTSTDRMVADAPVDLDLLFRAAVATFRDVQIGEARWPATPIGRVINHEQAERRLSAISNERTLVLASRFVSEVTWLADGSPCEQDLLFLLDLFLITLQRATPESIESGEISRASRRLEDPDYW